MAAADIEGWAEAPVELAARLDAQGRHAEAVDCLSRAGRGGNARALGLLGLRLLTGDRAPFLPAEGARLLGDAAGAGDAEAAGRLAVLIGGGFYARQSWPAALDCLQRSAELGSAFAQTQLRILAGAETTTEPAAPDLWRRLRGGVDIAAWLAVPPSVSLSDSPSVRAVPGLIPPAACAWVISQAQPRLVRAELYDPATGGPVVGQETRVNRIANFGLADTNLLNLVIQARIAAAMAAPLDRMESFAVLHYAPGEEYGEHVDFLDPAEPAYAAEIARMGQRVATGLVYLNEGYEGGATEFPLLGLGHRARAGDALLFVSADAAGTPDPRTVHAGRAPTSGEKWLLSQFVRNRPVIGVAPRTR